jgi:hypothetical protein
MTQPGFVILRELAGGCYELVGEARRRPGLPARKARAQAVLDATDGKATRGERYAAVLRSEWRIALDFELPE